MPYERRSRKLIEAIAEVYPDASEILVSFPESWELVEVLPPARMREPVLYVASTPAEEQRPSANHFDGVLAEENLEHVHYRLYRFFEPWLLPTVYIDWSAFQDQGTGGGYGRAKVQLQDLGDAQTWTGKRKGVLWECLLNRRGQERVNWQELLAQVWRVIEKDMGVEQIFTPGQDPEFEQTFYQEFLKGLGYAPIEEKQTWWSKSIR